MEALAGKQCLVSVKRPGDANYLLAVCQTSLTFTPSRDENSTPTKCGVFKEVGPFDATASIEGVVMLNITTGDNAISWSDLFDMIKNDVIFSIEIVGKDANSDEALYIQADTCKFNSLPLTAPEDGKATFTGDITFLNPSEIVTNITS